MLLCICAPFLNYCIKHTSMMALLSWTYFMLPFANISVITRTSGLSPESSRRVEAPPLAAVVLPRKPVSTPTSTSTQKSAPRLQSLSLPSWTLPQPQLPPQPLWMTVTSALTTATLKLSTCPVSPPLQPPVLLLPIITTSTLLRCLRRQWRIHSHDSQETLVSQLFPAWDLSKRIFNCLSFSPRLPQQWQRHCFMVVVPPLPWIGWEAWRKRRLMAVLVTVAVVVEEGWQWVPLSLTACGLIETAK